MRIDCYGRKTDGETFAKNGTVEPSETKSSGGFTYNRFGGSDPCAIHRLGIAEDGRIEETWGWGDWRSADSLSYIPIEKTMEVNE